MFNADVYKFNIPVWFAFFSSRLYIIGHIITISYVSLYVLYTFIGVFYEIIIIIINDAKLNPIYSLLVMSKQNAYEYGAWSC